MMQVMQVHRDYRFLATHGNQVHTDSDLLIGPPAHYY